MEIRYGISGRTVLESISFGGIISLVMGDIWCVCPFVKERDRCLKGAVDMHSAS